MLPFFAEIRDRETRTNDTADHSTVARQGFLLDFTKFHQPNAFLRPCSSFYSFFNSNHSSMFEFFAPFCSFKVGNEPFSCLLLLFGKYLCTSFVLAYVPLYLLILHSSPSNTNPLLYLCFYVVDLFSMLVSVVEFFSQRNKLSTSFWSPLIYKQHPRPPSLPDIFCKIGHNSFLWSKYTHTKYARTRTIDLFIFLFTLCQLIAYKHFSSIVYCTFCCHPLNLFILCRILGF